MIPFFIIIELLIFCLGATAFIYRPSMMVSEAICLGIILALLTLSCLYQVVFLIGQPQLAFLVEILLVIACLILLRKRSNYLKKFKTHILQFYGRHKILATLLIIPLLYLGLQATILPPSSPDFHSYHLPRVLLFQQEKSLFLENVTTIRQAVFPVGWNILNHAFLRFYTDYGLGIFAFLIYLSIGCGLYAITRKLTSENMAIVATIAVISMPQVVLQAPSMNTDIPLAGIAIFSFLTLSRLSRQLNFFDIGLLILAIAFGLSIKLTYLLFVVPFVIFGLLFLLSYYNVKSLVDLLLFNWKFLILLIFPVMIMSQIWLYIYNYQYWGAWSGPPDYVDFFQQKDGLKGGVANLIRHLFQSIDLTKITDVISYYFSKQFLSDYLEQIYQNYLYPILGDAGVLQSSTQYKPFQFGLYWDYDEAYSWYGILGFFLSIPSILYATLKGKHLPKITGITLICFFFLVSYEVGWSPWRSRYFSLFFVSSGICIAYTLDSLSLWLKNKVNIINYLITIISIITLWLTIIGNTRQPILNLGSGNVLNFLPQEMLKEAKYNNVWVKTEFGQKREQKRLQQELQSLIEPGSKLALIADFHSYIYAYLLAFPDVDIVPIHTSAYPEFEYNQPKRRTEYTEYQFPNPLSDHPKDFDYLLCLNADCRKPIPAFPNLVNQLIWHFQPIKELQIDRNPPSAQLFKLH